MPLRGAMAGPQTSHALGDESGLFLEFEGERNLDVGALYAALDQRGDLVPTGMRVTTGEVFDGLALWLALHEPDAGRLSAVGVAADRGLVPPLLTFPGMVATAVLLRERELAALVRLSLQPDQQPTHDADDLDRIGAFQLGVRALGAGGGGELAQRLVDAVRRWAAGGAQPPPACASGPIPQTAPSRATLLSWPSSTPGSCSTGRSTRTPGRVWPLRQRFP